MSGTGDATIRVNGLHPIGRGVDRPEHVLVGGDGRVFASDKASAVAELVDENTVRRIGQAGGEPNGIALDRDGHFLIANFGSGVSRTSTRRPARSPRCWTENSTDDR